jgi:spermidine/putrescine transport system substrate-binding protein
MFEFDSKNGVARMDVSKMVSALVALFALAAVASSCGEEPANAGKDAPAIPKGSVEGSLTISQWPLYIDPGKNGTVREFEAATGVSVEYIEEINDNVEIFGKLRPMLERGDSGNRSLITVSDWLAARMFKLGYLHRLDPKRLPNVEKNLIPVLRHPEADPRREFTVPWQSGMTGLIVRKDLAPDVDEIKDMFDPRYKGKVTMLTEMRDSVPMTLKSMGIDPAQASTDEWLAAVEKIEKAAADGQIRRFTGNDYIKDLPKGDSWISLGWSGDAVQLKRENPNIEFVMPKEGCMLWSTSMEIPVGAPNPQAALAFMNFVYDPKVQADIAEYVNYVTPVKGVKEILRKRDPELAENELIFPSQDFTRNCSFEPVLGGDRGQAVTEAFQQAIGN